MHRRVSGALKRKPRTEKHERERGLHFRGNLNPKTVESGWSGVGRLCITKRGTSNHPNHFMEGWLRRAFSDCQTLNPKP